MNLHMLHWEQLVLQITIDNAQYDKWKNIGLSSIKVKHFSIPLSLYLKSMGLKRAEPLSL